MEFTPFSRSHFQDYRAWFSDPWLQAALGPMDEEWLEYILEDKTGAQFAVLNHGVLIAVVGVIWAHGDQPAHTVSDLAIRPDQRRQGLGEKVLYHLIHHLETPQAKAWITYVEAANTRAIDFMKKCHWELIAETPMYTFKIKNA